MKWEMVKLGDVCLMNSGGTPNRSEASYYEGNIPWAKISDMENTGSSIITQTEEYITESGLKAIGNKTFPAGTLLLAMYGASVGKMAFAGTEISANQAILGIRAKNKDVIDQHYLGYWFKSIKEKLVGKAVGGAQPNISLGIVKDLQIPLPPLATQKRIAAILDAADALRRKDQALLQKYDELAQSIFVDMFGDPVKNEKGFESTKLEKVLAEGKNKIRSGPFGSDLLHSEFVSEGISVLGIDNVVNNRFEVGKERYITPEKFKSLSRYQVFPDDVLITIMGTTGRSAVVPKGIGTAINTKHLVAITPNKEIIDSIFLSYSLTKDPGIIAQIKRKSRGAIMEGLNMGIIKDLNFNLPPISLQKKFVESISKIDSMKEKITASSSETLFQSLLQKAFNAELVP